VKLAELRPTTSSKKTKRITTKLIYLFVSTDLVYKNSKFVGPQTWVIKPPPKGRDKKLKIFNTKLSGVKIGRIIVI
jgi:hypothetical protein